MRADFAAAAMTPPMPPSPPICVPTAMALERSFTASPLHSPACAGSTPTTMAVARNVSIATTLKRNITAMATPCSSRWARTTGAMAFTAEAPQIIVPPAIRSTSGRRTPRRTPST